jgi:ribonuclease P protein component
MLQVRPSLKSSYSFPASFRLKSDEEIKAVLAYAKKYWYRSLSVFVTPNTLEHPRLAIVISKRYVAKAVARNRLKRIIRESFRLNQDKITSNDIIIFGYRGIATLTNSELEQCLLKNWQKLVVFPKK